MLPLHKKVAGLLTESTNPLLIALSGGADSVAVLLVLHSLYPERVHAAHFNHNLRDLESAEDAQFCADLCRQHKIPFTHKTHPTPKALKTEASAREARLQFLTTEATRLKATIVTGHHLDDVAETMIMRLVRGSGCAGLSSPKPISYLQGIPFVRPLLDLPKAEITAWLEARQQVWRTDHTNNETDFTRNKIRHLILPELLKIEARNTLGAIRTARNTLEEEDAALNFYAAQFTPDKNGVLDVSRLKQQPPAVIKRVLYTWLEDPNLSNKGMEDLVRFIQTKTTAKFSLHLGLLQLSKGKFLKKPQ